MGLLNLLCIEYRSRIKVNNYSAKDQNYFNIFNQIPYLYVKNKYIVVY